MSVISPRDPTSRSRWDRTIRAVRTVSTVAHRPFATVTFWQHGRGKRAARWNPEDSGARSSAPLRDRRPDPIQQTALVLRRQLISPETRTVIAAGKHGIQLLLLQPFCIVALQID